MEGWLQGSNCGRPWGPLDILQGEAPRGDVYQGHPLLQGTVGEQRGRLGVNGRGLAGQMPPLEPFSGISVGFTPRRTHLLGEPVRPPQLSEFLLLCSPVIPRTSLSTSLTQLYFVALLISTSDYSLGPHAPCAT